MNHKSQIRRNHYFVTGTLIALLLTLAPGLMAQSSDAVSKSDTLTATTNGAALDLAATPHVANAANTNHFDLYTAPAPALRNNFGLGAVTISANTSYPISAAASSGADSSATIATPGWARGIAAGVTDNDSSEHDAHLKWVQAH